MLVIVFVPVVFFFLAARNANRVFLVRVSDGKVKVVSGRVPPSLLSEFKDVFRGSKASGTLSAVIERRAVRLVPKGDFDEGSLQRARNVLGRYPLAKLRAAAPR